MSPDRVDRAGDRGQSTVELALVLPVLFVAILMAVELAGVVQARLMVVHASREAGRALIADPGLDVHARALAAASFDPARLQTEVIGAPTSGQLVTVVVRYRILVRVPLLGIVAEPTVISSVVVQLE